MQIHRRSGFVKGKGYALEKMIFYHYKGRQYARCRAESITMPMTKDIARTHSIMTELGNAVMEMPKYWRDAWANCFNHNPFMQEVHDSVRFPRFMKRHSLEHLSWQNTFVFSNILAAHSGLSYPRLKPPAGRFATPPHPQVRATLDEKENKIKGEILLARTSKMVKEIVLRLWVAMQYGTMADGTIHQIFNVSDAPLGKIVVPFSIGSVRCAGSRFGVAQLPLQDILFGSIYVWADCVTTYGQEYGAKPSPYSNVEELTMPRKVILRLGAPQRLYEPKPQYTISQHALTVLHHIMAYCREVKKRYKTRVNYITDWRITDATI